MQYIEVNPPRIKSFANVDVDAPELIHIIYTGHKDMYIVCNEDALEQFTGETEYLSSYEISLKYGITI
jgi:hypothetical protein